MHAGALDVANRDDPVVDSDLEDVVEVSADFVAATGGAVHGLELQTLDRWSDRWNERLLQRSDEGARPSFRLLGP